MRRLIVNADDFGLTSGVNDGIVQAHRAGIVTSASLMVKRPGAPGAAAAARRHPALSIGLHFDDHRADAGQLNDPWWIEDEFARQLERFGELVGADPTHVDSHHHVHLDARRLATFKRLVAPLRAPLRGVGQVAYIGAFYAKRPDGVTELERVGRRSLLGLIANHTGAALTELGCHPGRVTVDLASSYVGERETELETLTSPGLRQAIEDLGVQLVSYHAWRQ